MNTVALQTYLPQPDAPLNRRFFGPLQAKFYRHAARAPERLATVDAYGARTYGELGADASRLAGRLIAVGVRPGDLVAIRGRRCARLVEALLGVLEAGAAYVILDPDHPPAHQARCLGQARPRALIELEVGGGLPPEVEEQWAELGGGVRLRLPLLGLVPAPPTSGSAAASEVEIGPDHRAYVAFTSGSTGKPKGVVGSHGPPGHFLAWARRTFDFTADDRFSMLSGLGHDPLLRDIFTPLSIGATLEIPGSQDVLWPARLVDWLLERRITVVHLTPAMARFLASASPEESRGTTAASRSPLPLRWALFAGDTLNEREVVTMESLAPGVRCVNFYGATETPQAMGWFSVPSAGERSGAERAGASDSGRVPIGRGIDGVQLLILGDSSHEGERRLMAVGEAGEICVRTPHLAAGYLDDDARTRERFVPNPFTDDPRDLVYRTGDLGCYLADGNVDLLGRLDRVVSIRGYRVELEEIETLLRGDPRVRDAAVVVLPQAAADPRLAACFTADDPAPSAEELRRFLGERLPGPSVPAEFKCVAGLPLTSNGKLDRAALERLMEGGARGVGVAPRSPVEELLSGLWGEVLGRPAPGAHDDFFEFGGHSLHATQITSRLRQLADVELPARTLFDHPTVARLATALTAFQRVGKAPTAVPLLSPRRGGGAGRAHAPQHRLPLSFAQERLWFLAQLAPDSHAYNLPAAFELMGELEPEALARAVHEVVDRHEALRTSFPSHGGQVGQEIAPSAPVPLPWIDLRALPRSVRRLEALRLMLAGAQRTFDLARGPLLRVSLLQLGKGDYRLLVVCHHIVSDGWSQGVFHRELAACYRRLTGRGGGVLPELAVQYADFALWQRGWLRGEPLERQLDYWRQRLAGAPRLTRLPADRPRPAAETYRGARRPLALPAALGGSLRQLADGLGASLYMVLAAGFAAWLHRATGRRDMVIGCPIANRNRREIEGLIGFFVNMLALRVDLAGGPTCRALVDQVRGTTLDAYGHQDLPFEKLIDELAPERDLGHHPLFQITLALHNTPEAELELPGISARPVDLDFEAVRFDLELHFHDTAGEFGGHAIYSTDLFDGTTVERWLRQLTQTLGGLASGPDQRLDAITLLTPAQRHQMLREWNDSAVDWREELSVPELFRAQTEHSPHAVAVVQDGAYISYQELARRSAHLARRLRGLRLGPGDRVAVAVDRGPEMVAALLAVLATGAAYVPLDPEYPEERLAFMLADSGARVMIAAADLSVARGPEVDLLVPEAGRGVAAGLGDEFDVTPSHAAYLLYTSGSAGTPKGVAICHGALTNRLLWSQDAYPLSPRDRVLQQASIAFDFSAWEIYAPLTAGAALILLLPGEHRDVECLARRVREQRVTALHFVPSLLRAFLDLEDADLSSVARVFCGGEALTAGLLDRLRGACGGELYNQYGPTEATIDATWHPLGRGDGASSAPRGGATVAIGRPIANLRADVLDAGLRPVLAGAPGELILAGRGLANGYHRRPGLTAGRFLPDPLSGWPGHRLYRSGDLARRLADGNIEFLGRIDHQVKIRGARVELGEIEGELAAHPAVKAAAVVVAASTRSPMAEVGGARADQLVAYLHAVRSDPSAEQAARWRRERVGQWRMVHDDTYGQEAPRQDPTFDIVGWNSSYSGEPIPPEEMREWVDDTVERILAVSPRRVLEIGCGSGLLLFRVAPHCQHYRGTDFSAVGLAALRRHVAARPELAQVELCQQAADDFSGVGAGAFDTVVLNSVVQYFPDVAYLLAVLRGAAEVVAPGGTIFIGDVRCLELLSAFAASVELFQADAGLPVAELRERALQRRQREEELVIDPALFTALRRELLGLHRVEILPKVGRSRNELTRFRYDVVLRFDGDDTEGAEPTALDAATHLDWSHAPWDGEDLGRILSRDRPRYLSLENIPDPRLTRPLRLAELLAKEDHRGTVAGIRRAFEGAVDTGLEPADLLGTAREHGYRVQLCGAGLGTDGTYRAWLSAPGDVAVAPWSEGPIVDGPTGSFTSYANDPLRGRARRELVGELREHLGQRLPEAMRPTHFVVLDRLPRLPAGKIDRLGLARRALPARGDVAGAGVAAPRTPLEEAVAKIWGEVLGLVTVGVHDNFFDLGGHSLLATQVVARLRQTLRVNLPLRQMFERPTVARLAELVARTPRSDQRPIPRAPRDGELPLSFSQGRLWFLHQLEPASPAYNMPEAHRFSGSLSPAALEGALLLILRRHEVLRTIFPSTDGRPRQVVESMPRRCLPVVDLAGLAATSRRIEARRLVDREAARAFDLARGPLLRVMLLRVGARDHTLFLNLHHILSDDWSQGILHRELAALYRALAAGREPTLPVPPIQYADFAHWQRRRISGERLETLLAYWRRQLDGELPSLALPADRSRSGGASSRGGAVSLAWPPELTSTLERLAKERGASFYMILLAAVMVMLRRLGGQRELAVGSPIANRDRVEVEGLIGCFVNTLVMRGRVSDAKPFSEFLEQVRHTALSAYAHQELPFERLVEALRPERDTGRNPFFQVTLTRLGPRTEQRWPVGLSRHAQDLGFQAVRLDLEIMLWPVTGGTSAAEAWHGKIVYRRELFDATTVGRWAMHLETLLRGIAAAPSRPLASLPLLDDARRHQLLTEWNDTGVPRLAAEMPAGRLLHQPFEAWAVRCPDRVAVVFEHAALSYGELDRQASRMAHRLRRAGVVPDEPVGVYLERSLDLAVALLGVLKAGGAYLPLDLEDPNPRLRRKLESSGVRVVLTQPRLRSRFAAEQLEVMVVEPGPTSSHMRLPPLVLTAEHAAYMLYTSGSTGHPKLTVIPHGAVADHLRWMRRRFGSGQDDRFLQKSPLSFDISVWELFAPLIAGATLVMARPDEHKDAMALARTLTERRITLVHFVPSMLRGFLTAGADPRPAGGAVYLRRIFSGGEALPLELAASCLDRLDAALDNTYGPTETTITVAHQPCHRGQGCVRIGRAVADTELYLTDDGLHLVPPGVRGELLIGGVQLARGYRGRGGRTAACFVPDPFSGRPGVRLYRSGDLGRWSADGAIEFLGRRDHQVKIRGVRIESGEIEAALGSHPGLVAVAVIVLETAGDDPRGARLVACFVPRGANGGPARAPRASELRAFLAERLPAVMIPAVFLPLVGLPLTQNGKLDRAALSRQAAALIATARREPAPDFVAPRSATEETLARVWSEVLGVERIGVHDDFFELGGHSLIATQVVSRIRRHFRVELPVTSLFEESTVARLGRRLALAGEESASDPNDDFEEGGL